MLQCVFTSKVSVSVGVISTATITAGYSRSDCTSFTVNQNLESPGSISEEVEEGVNGPSQAIVEGCLKNTEVLANLEVHLSHLNAQERVDISLLANLFS